jgi:hypothetical protein
MSGASLADYLSAESFDHPGKIFTGEYGVVYDEIAHRLSVFAPFNGSKFLHDTPP